MPDKQNLGSGEDRFNHFLKLSATVSEPLNAVGLLFKEGSRQHTVAVMNFSSSKVPMPSHCGLILLAPLPKHTHAAHTSHHAAPVGTDCKLSLHKLILFKLLLVHLTITERCAGPSNILMQYRQLPRTERAPVAQLPRVTERHCVSLGACAHTWSKAPRCATTTIIRATGEHAFKVQSLQQCTESSLRDIVQCQ